MASSLKLSLTGELRSFVDSRVGNAGVYATPSEYLRDLIQRDMAAQDTAAHILGGVDDVGHGRIVEESILDIANEYES